MTDGWLRRRSDTSFPGGGLIIPSRRNTGAPFPLPPGNLRGAKLCLRKMRETAATPSNEHTVCPKLFDTVPTTFAAFAALNICRTARSPQPPCAQRYDSFQITDQQEPRGRQQATVASRLHLSPQRPRQTGPRAVRSFG